MRFPPITPSSREQAETRPVARRGQHLTRSFRRTRAIELDGDVAHAERAEQFGIGEAQHVRRCPAGRIANEMRENERVTIMVIPGFAGLRLQGNTLGIVGHIRHHELHAVDRFQRGAE
jgi:hypothetical protein